MFNNSYQLNLERFAAFFLQIDFILTVIIIQALHSKTNKYINMDWDLAAQLSMLSISMLNCWYNRSLLFDVLFTFHMHAMTSNYGNHPLSSCTALLLLYNHLCNMILNAANDIIISQVYDYWYSPTATTYTVTLDVLTFLTRSSAIAGRPCDAKACQG